MPHSIPSPDASSIEIDYSEYLDVADQRLREVKYVVKFILTMLIDELHSSGMTHFLHLSELAADYGWCVNEVWKGAVFLAERGVIRLDVMDRPEPDDCVCGSCMARRSHIAFAIDGTVDADEARRRKSTETRLIQSGITPDPQEGTVYLVQAGERFKIGVTTKLQRRIEQLNSGQAPFPIELIHHVDVPHYHQLEYHLHKTYQMCRAHGEWFLLGTEDIAAVIEIMNEWAVNGGAGHGVD